MYKVSRGGGIAFGAVLQVVLCGLSVVTEVFASPLQADADSFTESFDPSVKVAGQVRIGFMHKVEHESVGKRPLTIDFGLPSGQSAGIVCIDVASVDGVYSAHWTTTVAGDNGEQREAEYPTRMGREISLFAPMELVALASLGDDCEDQNRVYLPTSWGMPESLENLRIFLNAEATEVQLVREGGGDVIGDTTICKELVVESRAAAYDTVCEFVIDREADDVVEKAHILRRDFETRLDNVVFMF